MLALAEGQVDLWFTRTARVHPALAARCHALLSPQEQALQRRFLFEKDRHRFLVTRALVRDVLSHYVAREPHEWRFNCNQYGKPHIAEATGLSQDIAFNISHTDGLVTVAVSRDRALGVDIENVQRTAPLDIAERYFCATECRSMRRLPAARQATRFWELWTLKESYIKARGMGLSIPLDQFGFDLDIPNSVSIGFTARLDDLPSRWQFWQCRPTEDHLMALCIEAPGDKRVHTRICVREAVPLSGSCTVEIVIDRCSEPRSSCSKRDESQVFAN